MRSINAKTLLGFSLDLFFPPRCPITDEPVSAPTLICADGWNKLQFIDDPHCKGCGAPFETYLGDDALCGSCLAEPLGLDEVHAAIIYNDAAHKLIVSFKHSDQSNLSPLLGNWLWRAGRQLIDTSTIIAPVPLHRGRLFYRRYNQSALLAKHLAAQADAVFAPQLLVRNRPTPPQQSLSADARRRNVAGAFECRDAEIELLAGAHVMLVDDVLTTGSTLKACAQVLRKAGVSRVSGLVVARVVKSGEDAI